MLNKRGLKIEPCGTLLRKECVKDFPIYDKLHLSEMNEVIYK